MSTAALHPLRPLGSTSPALSLLPLPSPAPGRPGARPALRLLEGGQAPAQRARRARYRRRRVAALVVAAAAAAALVLLVGAISTRLADGGHPSAAVGATSPTPAAASSAAGVAAPSGGSRIVQPGDTLWSIAADLAPGRDLRPVVDRLVELNGGGDLVVGARLLLP